MSVLNRFVVTALGALGCSSGASASETAISPYSDRVKIAGPAACAIDNAYQQWVTGPLEGHAPAGSGFSAEAGDASANPIVVTFRSTSGSSPARITYSIASQTCVDSFWPALPSSEQYSTAPIALSGTYVLALIAADVLHAQAQPATFTPSDSFPYTTSLRGSGVVITTTSDGNYIVGYYQTYDFDHPGYVIIGCYKEQHFRVTATTYIASHTRTGCPG